MLMVVPAMTLKHAMKEQREVQAPFPGEYSETLLQLLACYLQN